ncbi:VanZ family protein [Priestia taiwanensis]|uniref:VanZ family protein n=1 Tax=Priestia taiwanensis TaxID=1347902 RepID=A0A917AYM5_9BACI|nr:VanZ family protein [Priestia taiwanensis]MBM7364356.1 VanZ family protein [Priestia taiwanensis]GGE85101.1 VanZ family protein [Priestia taiwanensis]
MKQFRALLPVIFIAAIIFHFSNQPYQKQDMRTSIGNYVSEEWVKEKLDFVSFDYAGKEISIESIGVAGFIEFFIRKGAHFSIFFLLGFFLFRALENVGISRKKAMLFTFIAIILYAILDELHQMYTGDRTPLVQDVMIDVFGGITAIFLRSILVRKKGS